MSQESRPISLPYRAEIDGMRAIAVLAVVLYHADLGPAGGLVGVDVFFVISGYLITLLLCRQKDATGQIDLISFYARRVRRILPALVFVVIASVAASMVVLSPFGPKLALAQSAVASLLFVGNFFFQVNSGGYFDPNSNLLPLLHLWSLSVEEQFYLIWPVLLAIVLRLPSRRRGVSIVTMAAASLALSEALISVGSSAAFYQMTARFWELASGGLVALQRAPGQRDGRLPVVAGLILLLAATLIRTDHFPGVGAMPAVAGAASMLYGIQTASELGVVGRWLRLRPMVFGGLISYSLYLWHWPMLALYRASHVGVVPVVVRITLILAAVLIAWLSYRFIEKPWRRPDPKTTSAGVVASGLAMLAALAWVVLEVGRFFHEEPPRDDLASRTSRDSPSILDTCHYGAHSRLHDFPRPGCTSATDKPVRVVIWGDSHALAWQPMAWAIAQRDGSAATSFTRDFCAPALDYDNGFGEGVAALCREFNEKVFQEIIRDHIDTLILTALWPDSWRGAGVYPALRVTLDKLAPHVRRIILLGPTPYLRDSAPRCIELGNEDACAVRRENFEKQYGSARSFLSALAAGYGNVEYVDMTDFFCGQDSCRVIKDGYGLYWDSNHVSSTAARRFSLQYLGIKQADRQPTDALGEGGEAGSIRPAVPYAIKPTRSLERAE